MLAKSHLRRKLPQMPQDPVQNAAAAMALVKKSLRNPVTKKLDKSPKAVWKKRLLAHELGRRKLPGFAAAIASQSLLEVFDPYGQLGLPYHNMTGAALANEMVSLPTRFHAKKRAVRLLVTDWPDFALQLGQSAPVPAMAQPDQSAPVPAMAQPDQSAPVLAMVQPDQSAPVAAMAQPDQSAPVPAMVQPDQSAPVPAMAQPDQSAPVPAMAQPVQSAFVPAMVQLRQLLEVLQQQLEKTTMVLVLCTGAMEDLGGIAAADAQQGHCLVWLW